MIWLWIHTGQCARPFPLWSQTTDSQFLHRELSKPPSWSGMSSIWGIRNTSLVTALASINFFTRACPSAIRVFDHLCFEHFFNHQILFNLWSEWYVDMAGSFSDPSITPTASSCSRRNSISTTFQYTITNPTHYFISWRFIDQFLFKLRFGWGINMQDSSILVQFLLYG